MGRTPEPTRTPRERVIVCGVIFPDAPAEFEGELSEARALAAAAEADVIGEGVVQRRARPNPATLMGKGKVDEVAQMVGTYDPDAVVVDNDLTPAQGRNLEKAWCKRVIDRSELILDIFARRAKTRQASLQVELAQAEYLLPRLRRMWTHLERTEGAIGTRGPGETQLETDKRLLRKRVRDLKAQLKEIELRKRREVKSRSDQFTVGLVGYTNAGKSTLLNRLTQSDELVADMPFATLDTRTRRWQMSDGRQVLLSDTVGFLQRLPHHLVASFHATLEETLNADLLLNVVDASHPDAGNHIRAVDEVLSSLSKQRPPEVVLFNKVDRVDDPISLHLLLPDENREVVYLSAHTGDGLDRVEQSVWRYLDERSRTVDVFIPVADGRSVARVRAQGAVIEEDCCEEHMRVRVRISIAALGNLKREVGEGVRFSVVEGVRAGEVPG